MLYQDSTFSIPIIFRPFLLASAKETPEPRKGSKTVPPGTVDRLISFSYNSVGFSAG